MISDEDLNDDEKLGVMVSAGFGMPGSIPLTYKKYFIGKNIISIIIIIIIP